MSQNEVVDLKEQREVLMGLYERSVASIRTQRPLVTVESLPDLLDNAISEGARVQASKALTDDSEKARLINNALGAIRDGSYGTPARGAMALFLQTA